MDEWMHSVSGLDPDCLVWLLYLANAPGAVSHAATSDFHSHRNKVERFAQSLGVTNFSAKNGFDRLTRAPVTFKGQTKPIIDDDKSDRLLRLSRKVGWNVVLKIGSDPNLQDILKERLGIKADDSSWFPFDVPDNAPVGMTGRGRRTDPDGFTSFTITASLNCVRCRVHYSHEYEAVFGRDNQMVVESKCQKCGHINNHLKIVPMAKPW